MNHAYTYVYNFYGDIYETDEPFDETYRAKMRECLANGEPVYRQVINNITGEIRDENYSYGAWF